MKFLSGAEEYFALDIGTTAVRVIQLSGTGPNWSLSHYGVAPIDFRISSSDAPQDQRKLSEVILSVVAQSGIRAKDVVVGAPSSKVFATVVDMPNMPDNELATTIKYQADQYIPMSSDEAKIDWAVLGKSSKSADSKEVLLASTANSFIESRLDLIEGLGFNVMAIEPESIALTRSLQPPATPECKLIIELGDYSTDIIMTFEDAPRLIRSVQVGSQTFIKAASQNLNIDLKQAYQFISKFGLQADKLEGQVYRSIESSVGQFAAEITKSVKFFQTKYPNVPVNGIILSNNAATIPGMGEYLSEKIGIPAVIGNPWQRVQVSAKDQVNLQALTPQLAVAIGLAQRGVEA